MNWLANWGGTIAMVLCFGSFGAFVMALVGGMAFKNSAGRDNQDTRRPM